MRDRSGRRRFWELVRRGRAPEEAAAELGIGGHTGREWFRQAGGVVPAYVRTTSNGRSLSLAERETIYAGVVRGASIRSIARDIHRSPSTVQRELGRNTRTQYRPCPRLLGPGGRPRTQPCDYRPHRAQLRAEREAARPKPSKLATCPQLRNIVQRMLEDKLSPEQIAHELRQEYPNHPELWVSHETIYQAIYVQARGGLRRDLAKCLRTGRALRKPHRQDDQRRHRIPGSLSISERPAEVDDRAIPGHWEGDLILGEDQKSAIGTLVERTTRFVMLLHLPHDHSSSSVAEAMIAATHKLPQVMWKSLTWDQGREMYQHLKISTATNLEIYFCDPHSPWQRGSNENTNGLLRQYFPKGTDLSVHSAEYLEFVSAQMNRRPRKTLRWQRPADELARLLSRAGAAPEIGS